MKKNIILFKEFIQSPCPHSKRPTDKRIIKLNAMKDEAIIAYLKKESSPEESDIMENWILQSTENKNYFNGMKLIWDNSKADFSHIQIDTRKAWDRVQSSASQEESDKKSVRMGSMRIYFRIAASLVILLSIGYLSYRLIDNNPLTDQNWNTVQTTTESSDVELPDGTHVWLNHNTSVTYPAKFRSRLREVQLSGEAYFEVEKNRRKPFVVDAESSMVEVLGTSFNVEADHSPTEVIVTVVTGKVALFGKADPTKKVFLEPGENGTFNTSDGGVMKEINRDHNFLAWKTGILVFDNASMAQVCSTLSDYFGTPVIHDPQGGMDTKRLTATYDNKNLEEVLNILSLTLDILYNSEEERITLFSVH